MDLQFIYTLIRQNANTNLVDNNGCKPFDYLSDEMKVLVNMDKEKLAEKMVFALESVWDRDVIKETANKFKAENIATQYLKILDEVVS